jgi:hypothetical protein
MGFLSGAYGKLMAGKLVRDIQHQMTSVQSRLRRVTREVGLKEKMYQSQERNMKNMLQYQMYGMQMGLVRSACDSGQYSQEQCQQLLALAQGSLGAVMGGGLDMNSFKIGSFNTGITTLFSGIQQQAQMQFVNSQNYYQNIIEMQKEADLQALKDLEDDLQTEKDNLESRLKIAEGEYEAKKEEEKQGAQNLKPDYTGQ